MIVWATQSDLGEIAETIVLSEETELAVILDGRPTTWYSYKKKEHIGSVHRQHVQENRETESATEAWDHEARRVQPIEHHAGQEPSREFTEVNTRKGERRNAPPRDEQQ